MFEQIVVVAILIEAVITNLKPIWDKDKGWNIDMIVSLVLSVAVSTLANIDLFQMVKQPLAVPYVGAALTGIILSRGANVVHELIKSLDNFRQSIPQ